MDDVTLHCGDVLAVLATLETASVDVVVTDPPYSSGGMYRGDRTSSTASKYTRLKQKHYLPSFAGDNRDQRSYLVWCSLWLSEALRVAKPGVAIAVSTDWRQLPTTTDALQSAGWVWRGVLPWCKPDARPQQGRPRQAAEFFVWGTAGPREMAGECLPGYWVTTRSRHRLHQTEKPLKILRDLVRLAPPGGVVLDPFLGGGTTAIAARAEGRRCVGIDVDPYWVDVTRRRLDAERLASDDPDALQVEQDDDARAASARRLGEREDA